MKTKRIKAFTMYGVNQPIACAKLSDKQRRFYVLPADGYEQMRQQVDAEIERAINRWLAGTSGPDGEAKLAATVLASIGITQPKKGKK